MPSTRKAVKKQPRTATAPLDSFSAAPYSAGHAVASASRSPAERLYRSCLPSRAPEPPSGSLWVHEIKHDGIRCIARKNGAQVRLYSRPGNDLTDRFSLIVEAVEELRCRSCLIDGEAVVCDDRGMARFDRIRYRRHDTEAFIYAFDLIELDGQDLRREPLAVRKATLASLLSRTGPGLRLNEHLEHEKGAEVFAHACRMGLEGIVSKLKDSRYTSGHSLHWIKSKNPDSPAVKREPEEDWGKWSRRERRLSR